MRLSEEVRVKADGVVIFPHEFEGNTVDTSLFSNGSKKENTLISNTSKARDYLVIIFAGQITFVSLQLDRSHVTSTIFWTNGLLLLTQLWHFSRVLQLHSTYWHLYKLFYSEDSFHDGAFWKILIFREETSLCGHQGFLLEYAHHGQCWGLGLPGYLCHGGSGQGCEWVSLKKQANFYHAGGL